MKSLLLITKYKLLICNNQCNINEKMKIKKKIMIIIKNENKITNNKMINHKSLSLIKKIKY